MITHENYEIDSTDDIELGIKRSSKLEFIVTYDGAKPAKALFVFINGIRNADYAGYEQHLAEFVASTYEVAVLRVDYFCIGFRPQTGAKIYMDARDKKIFATVCANIAKRCNISIKLTESLSNDEILDSRTELDDTIEWLNALIEQFKSKQIPENRRIPQDYNAPISISLAPTKGEYLNFGVMQALDVLNAICFVQKNHAKFKLKAFKSKSPPPVILFGTSHGGYLAYLCAKFAPWLIDAVVENSAYATAPLRMLGLGKDIGYTQCFEVSDVFKNIALFANTKTHFSLKEGAPNAYTAAHDKIRSMPESDHLALQATCHKAVFVSYHSAKDELIALPEPKERLYAMLKALNYEARLTMIRDESEVDGRFIKNLSHGMGMSMKILVQKELPPLLERKFSHENERHEISYESEDLEYKFSEKDGKIKLSVRRLRA